MNSQFQYPEYNDHNNAYGRVQTTKLFPVTVVVDVWYVEWTYRTINACYFLSARDQVSGLYKTAGRSTITVCYYLFSAFAL